MTRENKQDTSEVKIIDHVVVMASARKTESDTALSVNDTAKIERRSTPEFKSFRYYPNPCHERLFIETEHDITELFVADANGKILECVVLHGKKAQVNLGSYPEGVYYLQYLQKEKWVSGKLIVLN